MTRVPRSSWFVGVVVATSGVLASATCKTSSDNPNYCSVTNGDAYCAAHHEADGRVYCIWGSQECHDRLAQAYAREGERFDGCVSEPPEVEDECYSPCGGGLEFQGQFECPAGDSSSTTEGEVMTTLPGDTSGGPPECMDGGCVPCVAHEDCEIGACDIFEGTCFPPGTQKTTLDDSMDDLGALVASVAPGEHHIIVLAGSNTVDPYAGSIVVSDSKTIAILDNGYGYPRPRIQAPEGARDAIEVTGGATLYMQGVEVSGHESTVTTPLSCEGAARLHARGTMITNNLAGTSIQDCEARFENCFFQSLDNDIEALRVLGDSDVELVYTTLVTNAGDEGGHNAVLSCFGASDIIMRNSLLLSLGGNDFGPEIEGSCDSLVLEHSIIESAPVFGVGNDVLEPPIGSMDMWADYSTWFCDYDSGDLHLDISNIDMTFEPHMTDSSHLEIAVPAPGDDTRDIDGDLRTTSAMVGADVPGSCPS